MNKDGTIVSFVEANELWNYNKDSDEVSLVFGFADAENTDVRNLVPDHKIKILKVDAKGNTTFLVSGYMNRGEHEGEVGQDFRPQATLELLQIVEGEVDRLSAMVSELLKLTNLERASRGERLSSGQLIRSAADQAAPQAEARSITILVDAAPCTLAGNAELLRQAVCNLVENAVKYSPAGSVVHIAGHRDGEWFQIVVADQGPGIPESLRQRIFEPFFRVDDSRSRQLGGAGLGLALVRAIAEFHGGAVYVEKSRGAGSRFVLKLPCEQDPPPD